MGQNGSHGRGFVQNGFSGAVAQKPDWSGQREEAGREGRQHRVRESRNVMIIGETPGS